MSAVAVVVELFYLGAWNSLTDVFTRDPITITRGRGDEVSHAAPSTLNLTLDDRQGTYSPRNPGGVLYGRIGRNTPIRVRVGADVRFVGEIESWPVRWNVKGSDISVPIVANGITRRLNAPGTTRPARSPLLRAVLGSATAPWAYWPMETDNPGDTAATAVLSSPLQGVAPLTQNVRGATFGQGFAGDGSGPVPDFTTGGILEADIPDDGLFSGTTGYTIEFVARYDNSTSALGGVAIRWLTPGTAGPTFWELSPGPNMDLFFGTTSTNQGSAGSGVDAYDGLGHHYRVTVQQSGANIIINLYVDGVLKDVGDDFGGGDPVVTGTVNRPTHVFICQGNSGNPTSQAPSGLGHVTFWRGITPPNTPTAATAYVGETAAARMARLCTEDSITFTLVGTASDTELMGVQRAAPWLDLMQDAADADGGLLYETRDVLGFKYRTHTDLYNQATDITLSYTAGGELAPPLDPVEDTDATGNDITVTRYQGGSANVVKATGTLNVQEPTANLNGVGRYKKDTTLVLAADSQCLQQAAWLRHLGTWDEPRYPVINLDLTAMEVAGKTALITSAKALDVGSRLTITNPPFWLPPDSIVQHAQGFTEVIESHRWTIAVNATPALPYDVLRLETDTTTNLSRIPAGVSITTEALDTTETGVDVGSTTVRWIDSATYASQFPFDVLISGERMRVTAITNQTPTFINVGTAAHSDGSTSVTPGLPASIQEGDLLLIWASVRGISGGSATSTPTTPTGYTKLLDVPNSGAVDRQGGKALFGKYAAASESAPTVSSTTLEANSSLSAQMAAFRYAQPTVLSSATSTNASAQDIITPLCAVPSANSLVLSLGAKRDDWTSVATQAGFTGEVGDSSTTLGNDQGLVWDYFFPSSTSDIAASSFVVTGGASEQSVGAVVVLQGGGQVFTVTRSINGVTKTHAAGAAVQLFRPPVIAR